MSYVRRCARNRYARLTSHSGSFEYFGTPFAANASVWPEHIDMLATFLEPNYASRFGAPMARLVQRRVLFDVSSSTCYTCSTSYACYAGYTCHARYLCCDMRCEQNSRQAVSRAAGVPMS